MKKAKLFLLGNKFKVVTDHSPLVKIFNDKSLADIENNRLLSLKEKTLTYTFSIHYIKGKENYADVLSRYPVNDPTDDDLKFTEEVEIASINVMRQVGSSDAVRSKDIHDAIKHFLKMDGATNVCPQFLNIIPYGQKRNLRSKKNRLGAKWDCRKCHHRQVNGCARR